MSKVRWTQKDEDSNRLPEGVKRVAYDADSSKYTFKDRKGTLYTNDAGDQYGHLKPILNPAKKVETERPEAFNQTDGQERYIPQDRSPLVDDSDSDSEIPSAPAPKSFQEMLSPEFIAPPPPMREEGQSRSKSGSSFSNFAARISPTKSRFSRDETQGEGIGPSSSPRSVGFADAVRKSALPKMQGVVHSLKRSVTSATRSKSFGSGRNRALSSSNTRASVDGANFPAGSKFHELEDDEERLLRKRSQED
ncbi:hypothetical protein FA15DRAFT_668487 [Coprinopsis marcescibilis]|uniref:Carbohydrate-binding module family 50 protein n=1 Tax=Coprinopsis marcescibilis TaxID=230819 RepID=A0A5C3KYQ5_COPMA|nr:hypothetical protein FA15DRAFT_668487 [Coprinopsis marcescibilis]